MSRADVQFGEFSYNDLFEIKGLERLDARFFETLENADAKLHQQLLAYRTKPESYKPTEVSEILICSAKVLETFLAKLFTIEPELHSVANNIEQQSPIFAFKKEFISKRAKRRVNKKEELPAWTLVNERLHALLEQNQFADSDLELSIATLSQQLLADEATHAESIELITQWCMHAMVTERAQAMVSDWVSFNLPNKLDYQDLVPLSDVPGNTADLKEAATDTRRERDGFGLTDKRMNTREVQAEVNYCVFCHDHDGDFCTKGFPVKKAQPELGLKENPLGKTLTGCPLDERISEMHVLRRDSYPLAALAMVMADNPMCPMTGHRICNDCMKACIYQKQDPVNIPQIETHVLTSVLNLPYGVEIYDLLTRWNPLRAEQYIPKPYNGLKVFIAGQGPAGFTLAYHLLMEGFAVVGSEGLKIEPLPEQLIKQPIRDYSQLTEALDERIMTGFGGVAEYGITVRWDKNFLKLIYLSLSRQKHYQVFGGVRFGGTMTVEEAWAQGFDHVAIAVGAGLPQALPVPGSLAPGMRQANDFLMALQLTGAAKKSSLTNLQIRLPAIVIGGGLTGVDAATEVQAYYLVQIEKIAARYLKLAAIHGEEALRVQFDEESLIVVDEYLAHAAELAEERAAAAQAGREPALQKLLRRWGGVSIAYRRSLQESPAYRNNHEEVLKAFEEGIYYVQGIEPKVAQLDRFGHVQAMRFHKRERNEQGDWFNTDTEVSLPAKCILVATGARPNIAYEFEHQGSFKRQKFQYLGHELKDGALTEVDMNVHVKTPEFGPFTSYQQDGHLVSFVGDTHQVFHGNVVNAIASAKKTYPKIVAALADKVGQGDSAEYEQFADKMKQAFTASVVDVIRHTQDVIELVVQAPMAAKRFKPGQFFRVQNYETGAKVIEGTKLQTEAMAMTGSKVDVAKGTVSLLIMDWGASSKLCASFKPGQALAFMGPTGVRTKIPEGGETVFVIGGAHAAAHIRAVGPEMRAAGNKVVFFACFDNPDAIFCRDDLEQAVDTIVWVTQSGQVAKLREQDFSLQMNLEQAIEQYIQAEPALSLADADRLLIVGSYGLLKTMQRLRKEKLDTVFTKNPAVVASISSTMQCMLKGVCAQCLQWQIDPATGERTKAVFACSWQDQPFDLVDVDNLAERQKQNRMQETLTNLWLDYLLDDELPGKLALETGEA